MDSPDNQEATVYQDSKENQAEDLTAKRGSVVAQGNQGPLPSREQQVREVSTDLPVPQENEETIATPRLKDPRANLDYPVNQELQDSMDFPVDPELMVSQAHLGLREMPVCQGVMEVLVYPVALAKMVFPGSQVPKENQESQESQEEKEIPDCQVVLAKTACPAHQELVERTVKIALAKEPRASKEDLV